MILAPKQVEYQQTTIHKHNASRNFAKQEKPVPKVMLVLMVLLAFVLGLFMTAKHAQLSMLGNEVNQLQKEIHSLKRENERLQLKIAQLSSPERVEIIATTKLGMQKPNLQQFELVAPLPETINDTEAYAVAANTDRMEELDGKNTGAGFIEMIARVVGRWVGGMRQVEASQF